MLQFLSCRRWSFLSRQARKREAEEAAAAAVAKREQVRLRYSIWLLFLLVSKTQSLSKKIIFNHSRKFNISRTGGGEEARARRSEASRDRGSRGPPTHAGRYIAIDSLRVYVLYVYVCVCTYVSMCMSYCFVRVSIFSSFFFNGLNFAIMSRLTVSRRGRSWEEAHARRSRSWKEEAGSGLVAFVLNL